MILSKNIPSFGGKDIFYLTITLAVVGAAFWTVDKLTFDTNKFWEGLTFDPATLGKPAVLTEEAQLSQADYIDLGYGELDENGVFRITPAGQEYINGFNF